MNFFTKTKKAIISLVLCIIMILPLGMSVFGLSASSGPVALRDVFRKNNKGEGKTYYSYYSPIEGQIGNTDKYPLVVFIGETKTNDFYGNGQEVKDSNFTLWASDEYQKRFYGSEGAFLMFMALSPLTYVSPSLASRDTIKTIKNFVESKKDNIDTERIYLVSWGDGCKVASDILADNPKYFAAFVAMSPTASLGDDFSSYSSVPTWLFACRADEAANFNKYGDQNWDAIKAGTTNLYSVRYTTFDTFNTTGEGIRGHRTWDYAAYDMHYTGEYSGAKTIMGKTDKNGRPTEVTFNGEDDGMISWLSKLGSDYGSDCDCQCHTATGFAKFLWMLKMLLSMMIKYEPNRICECGIAHW